MAVVQAVSDAAKTDLYSPTMRASGASSGLGTRMATFEVFVRRLPAGRRYGVVAGTNRVLEALENLRYDDLTIEYFRSLGKFSEAELESFRDYRFTGDVVGYPEGDVYFANSPIMTIRAPWSDAIVLEALVSGIFNSDSATAAAASRMRNAAGERDLMEMGGRRVDPDAAVHKARAAYIGGFDSTSNVAAGIKYGIPVKGTSAHAFVLAFESFDLSQEESEKEAFREQIRTQGVGTTLLVDTYDIERGIKSAVAVAQEFGATGPGMIRIDSKVLLEEAEKARRQLDELGAKATGIVLSGNLNEFVIDKLNEANSPANILGVGDAVALGGGAPTAEVIFKGVEIEPARFRGAMKPTAKLSESKRTVGGQKFAYRVFVDGEVAGEFLVGEPLENQPDNVAPVQVQLMKEGKALVPLGAEGTLLAKEHHEKVMATLPASAREVEAGDPALEVSILLDGSAERPRFSKVIVVVDPNNDFSVDGSLPVPGANDEYFNRLSEYLNSQPDDVLIVATSDEHIDPGEHWEVFPVHCEKGTWGAEFHRRLDTTRIREIFFKGNYKASFTGFDGVSRSGVRLEDYIRANIADPDVEVEVVGLATEYCDKATAKDSSALGFRTSMNLKYCRGITEDAAREAVNELESVGVAITMA